jgi:acyl transferase domain-containing protein
MNEEIESGDPFQSVAIIGSAGRFPGAASVREFWENIAAGAEAIERFSEDELRARGVPDAVLANPAYVRAGARFPDAEAFDPEFFDMTPREAEITDPQHRVLLECAFEALESAGYVAHRYPGSIGIYAGVGLNTYLINNLMPHQEVLRSLGMHQLLLGNDKCYATSRIAYKLNLRGPCLTIDTACSSSLVSVVLAYKSLISFECDMALAGGAKVNSADNGYVYEAGSINSPDGRCRTFDEEARGTVFGSGAGLVVLKRLEDAVRDRDNIHAVIRGAAINNDGGSKVGFTAPSVTGQRDAIRQALSFGEVAADSIGYVEAHGTGTQLGDPCELAALAAAFDGAPRGGCAIGSVKANVGHLETAAGVAGLIKVVEALRHRKLPPSIHFNRPHPEIDFETGPFFVNTQLREWDDSRGPRRACVSSFGLGGTNAHVVLEEAPPVGAALDEPGPQVLLVSAKSPEALDAATDRLVARLREPDAPSLADAAYTLACGRDHHRHRRFVVARDAASLVSSGRRGSSTQAARDPRLAFVIPGQGVQRSGMAAALYGREPAFRTALDRCVAALGSVGAEIRTMLLTPAADDAVPSRLDRTEFAQPAIFVTAYASAQMWLGYGLEPKLLIGHSLGEYVAGCIAGIFSLESALSLVVDRARLMQAQEAGAMAAVQHREADVAALLAANPAWRCDIAAVNTPTASVVSGDRASVDALVAAVRSTGGDARVLRTSHAFHSWMMDPMLRQFEAAVGRIPLQAPRIPVLSSLTGALLKPEQAVSPRYWADQLRRTVRFAEAFQTALDEGITTFLDIGPSATGSALAQANVASSGAAVVGGFPANGEDDGVVVGALGALWAGGHPVDWKARYSGRERRRVELPGYPFQRRRCWIDAVAPPLVPEAKSDPAPETVTESAGRQVDREEPRDEAELLIARIWQELLGVDLLSVHDNFFALGGQSLLATRVITRIEEETGIALPVRSIFDAPTIAGLAAALVEQRAAAEDPELLAQILAEIELEIEAMTAR